MDFKLVLERFLDAFGRENIRYTLMGEFAMGLREYEKEMRILKGQRRNFFS
jgi:hypothetical protein